MKRFTALLTGLLAYALLADVAVGAAGWTDYGTISEFNQQGNTTPGNEMLFVRTAVSSNPSGCSDTQSFYMPVVTDLQKRMFAMLLTAKSTGSRIRLYVTGNCHLWGSSEVNGMLIE
jgi:hypothetical protein